MGDRKLPLWMAANENSSSIPVKKMCRKSYNINPLQPISKSNFLLETTNVGTDLCDVLPRRRLCSKYEFPPSKNPVSSIEYLPFVDYNGTIEYYTAMHDIAFSCDQLLHWLQNQPTEKQTLPIAFDLEWPCNFQAGPGRTSLMQLCATTDRCLLLQLSHLKRLPAALLELMYHPRVLFHGVNIKNDFRKLARDFPGLKAEPLIAKCCDLGQWYNKLHGTTGIWSMERLVQQVLGLRINKDKRVRMSKWDVLPLTIDQKHYAAIDVYISQKLYLKLAETQLIQQDVKKAMRPEDDKSY